MFVTNILIYIHENLFSRYFVTIIESVFKVVHFDIVNSFQTGATAVDN